MVKAILDNKLRIKRSDLSREQLNTIREKFSFIIKGESVQLHGVTEHLVILPPNPSFVKEIIPDIEIKDIRKFETIDSPDFDCTLRPHQEQWDKELKECEYDAILKAPTSSGKSFYVLKKQADMKVPALYIAYQTTHIVNMERDISKHHPECRYQRITGDWDGELKDINLCTIQLLNKRPDIVEKLSNRAGLLFLDELHLILGGEQFRNTLYGLSIKYKIALSATIDVKEKGFTKAAWSANIVDTEDFNIVPIIVIPILLQFDPIFDIMGGNATDKKRAYGMEKKFIRSLTDGVEHLVKDRKRHIMVYNDLNETQEAYKKVFEKKGIRSAVINNNTVKKDVPKILSDFEDGLYDSIISGVMVRESVSIYKLSVIVQTAQIDASEFHNKNGLEQATGRLRRLDENICPHKKVVIDLIFSGMENKFHSRKAVYESIQGVKVLDIIESKSTDFRYILERMG